MKNLLIILLLLISPIVMSQTTLYKGKVIDSQTRKGISDVHIYQEADNLKGSITNEDGNFAILLDKSKDVYFSHIGYEPLLLGINSDTEETTIEMKPKSDNLDEVVISTLGADRIVERAIAQMDENHEVEPVFYDFYTLLVHFDSEDSTIHTVEEYVGAIYQNSISSTKYKFENIAIRTFTDIGKEEIQSHRMIAVTKMRSDNIFKYKENYFKKKKRKEYYFKLIYEVKINQRPCYVIEFGKENDTLKRGELFIDVEDFAIVRKTRLNKEGVVVNKVDFIKNNTDGKWYLHNTVDVFNYSTGNKADLRLTLYNKKEEEPKDGYIVPYVIKMEFRYEKKTEEEYYKNFNYIPLPDWIKERTINKQ